MGMAMVNGFSQDDGRKVIVLRGISGAGKSTLAKKLASQASSKGPTLIVSADQYFTYLDGSYQFDAKELPEAHGACLRRYCEALVLGRVDGRQDIDNALVIVDNTSTTVAEAAPYMALAAAYGWEALLVTFDVAPLIAAPRNIHGVEFAGVEAQYLRLTAETKRLPPFWLHTTVKP